MLHPMLLPHLTLLTPVEPTARLAPEPRHVTADDRFNTKAIMAAAHVEARANVARAPKCGVVRCYAAALCCALKLMWSDAQAALYSAKRDSDLTALPAANAAILAERAAALMIDSTSCMLAEVAAIDARAAATRIRL